MKKLPKIIRGQYGNDSFLNGKFTANEKKNTFF